MGQGGGPDARRSGAGDSGGSRRDAGGEGSPEDREARRVVLDTNVLVSGIWFGGGPRRIVDEAERGLLEPVVSPDILAEYRRVEARMLDRLGPPPHPEALATLVLASTVVPDTEGPPVTADPDDDKFMWAAWTADAVVVSGDRHLLDASGWRGVRVLTPRGFLRELDRLRD